MAAGGGMRRPASACGCDGRRRRCSDVCIAKQVARKQGKAAGVGGGVWLGRGTMPGSRCLQEDSISGGIGSRRLWPAPVVPAAAGGQHGWCRRWN
uniref:Uncharacterized protein n=1 Tax=Oryza punctata TaxID=4537 RepID=A0A0E0LLR7_ORYPU